VDGKPIAPGRVTCPLPPWDAAFPGASFSCRKTIRKRITPQQVLFTLLSVYPGTEEFELLRAEKIFDEETFFTQPVPTLKCYLGDARDFHDIQQHVERFDSQPDFWRYGPEQYEEILQRFPDLPEAHLDLASASCAMRRLDAAEQHAQRALALDYALPGLALNVLACVAASRGQFGQARDLLVQARGHYPHDVVLKNTDALETWLARGGPRSGQPLMLWPAAAFETHWVAQQPEKPGPL
jgi:tetratricopeptide (TPR) repeat protein